MTKELKDKKIKKKWTNLSKNVPKELKTDIPEAVLKLLFSRGIFSKGKNFEQEISNFLNPDYEKGLHDPFLLPDMDKAVKRIVIALDKKEKVVVYGDYDVDGVTSSALLADLFEKLKMNFEVYIPSRHDEGYGLSKEALKKLKENGADLVITVDCGVKSFDEIDYANEIGLEVIVTDHHEVEQVASSQEPVASEDVLLNAYAVINPKRADSKYPFKELAGVGVAFKLASAILESLDREGRLEKEFEIKKDYGKWLLDLAGFGTICDIVPLVGENRILAYYGLIVIRKSKRQGLKALAQTAGIDLKDIGSHNIGFHLGPRLNASGRLEHAKTSLNLLTARSYEEALEIGRELALLNAKRQAITQQILDEARLALVKKTGNLVLLRNKNWPAGVVGIVASRLLDECGKPVLILEEGDEESTGSARSIDNFNIVEALKKCEDILVRYGGHKKAAGLTVKNEHFVLLEEKLLKIAGNEIKEEDLVPEICYDAEIELKDVNNDLYSYLKKMEPFGFGNKTPVFLIKNLEIKLSRKVGKESNHLKLTLNSKNKNIEAMYFNFERELTEGEKIDIICTVINNEWNGTSKLELRIVDLKFS